MGYSLSPWTPFLRGSVPPVNAQEPDALADGTPFPFWDDVTVYRGVYHVSCRHPGASDENPGTESLPFATIGRAAQLLQPGEKVVVHEGVYRECVRPPRGGEGPDHMIAYEAAAGEEVCIRGSKPWSPEARPSAGWRMDGLPDGVSAWMADLPREFFAGYNPFGVRNMPAEYSSYGAGWTPEEISRALLYRGMVFADGAPLRQVFRAAALARSDGAFWVEEPGLRIHFRLPGDAEPAGAAFEVTVHEQVFAPEAHHLGYIRVSGFHLEHAADGVPVPQRALISTTRGHHWIIEDNVIRHANACGLDVGAQDWKAADYRREDDANSCGRHVIRRNRICECGICGIAGATHVDATLVEDNLIERIGGMNIERLWESAGLKFHIANDVLIRRNIFRHIRHGCGLWLDCINRNCRISGNVFADLETLTGAVFLECTHHLNLVDCNILWDVRQTPEAHLTPFGLSIDSGENIVVCDNLFGRIVPERRDPDDRERGFAVGAHLAQFRRIVAGRVGLCRRHRVLRNVFVECPRRILFGRADENTSQGNLFDVRDDPGSLCIQYPEPSAVVDFEAWREYCGLDTEGSQARIEASFDPQALELTFRIEGEPPPCKEVPGPFTPEQWSCVCRGETVVQRLPILPG